jgi:hypothetical protein
MTNKKRNPIITLSLSLRFAKEYLKMLCNMQKTYTLNEIQESEKLTIIQRALWTSLIIEVGRLFDTYEKKNKKVISFKKIDFLKKNVNNIHAEAIIGKIINTRNTFTAHWGEEKNKIVSVSEVCSSNLGILLKKLDKPLLEFEKWIKDNSCLER